jgi:gluconolactonase
MTSYGNEVTVTPNNGITRWDEITGLASVLPPAIELLHRVARDRQGRLLAREHLTRRITRTGYDGSITVLGDNFAGKRLCSSNDVVCRSAGSRWFSDPTVGIGGPNVDAAKLEG